MRFLFNSTATKQQLEPPLRPAVPELKNATLAVSYLDRRLAGDFFDFLVAGSRLVMLLMDVAGRQAEAWPVVVALQQAFRRWAPPLLGDAGVNESEALTELSIRLNRELMERAGGVRCCPCFLASYDDDIGMLIYINAGHTPAIVADGGGMSTLEPHAPPFGLFTHAALDAQFCALTPGSTLLAASKGLLELPRRRRKFGRESLQQILQQKQYRDAGDLCRQVIEAAEQFRGRAAPEDDATVMALVRA